LIRGCCRYAKHASINCYVRPALLLHLAKRTLLLNSAFRIED
jgi:hypothetical protein